MGETVASTGRSSFDGVLSVSGKRSFMAPSPEFVAQRLTHPRCGAGSSISHLANQLGGICLFHSTSCRRLKEITAAGQVVREVPFGRVRQFSKPTAFAAS